MCGYSVFVLSSHLSDISEFVGFHRLDCQRIRLIIEVTSDYNVIKISHLPCKLFGLQLSDLFEAFLRFEVSCHYLKNASI